LFGVSFNQAGYWPKNEHASEPSLENEQRILLGLFLNYRQGYEVPVDKEPRLFFLTRFCKMHLRHFTGIDGIAANRELLFEYAQFFEPRWKLESDNVLVDPGVQLDFDFKSHWHVYALASEILRPHKIVDPICASGDPLQNFQRKPNRCLTRAVSPNKQDGRAA
jgi:hypothetical protein